MFNVVRVNAVQPLAVVGQKQAGIAAEHALVRRADVNDALGIPVEGPEHGVDAVQQRTEQMFTLTQALHLSPAVQQRQGQFFQFWRKRRRKVARKSMLM